jgi:hypothetical protein
MASYITVQEGFVDDIKERVKHNIGDAADNVNIAMNSVHKFGQGVKDVAHTIAKGAYKVSKYMNDENEEPVKKKTKEEDDDDDYYDEASSIYTKPIAKSLKISIMKASTPGYVRNIRKTLDPFKKIGLFRR